MAFTSQRVCARENLYFDSRRCSIHMTWRKEFMLNIKPHAQSNVTFGDGVKARVIWYGKLNYICLPALENVLLINGLTTNLLSKSHLCDQDLEVHFTKLNCIVINDDSNSVMTSNQSIDDYYLWMAKEKTPEKTVWAQWGILWWEHFLKSYLNLFLCFIKKFIM